MKAFTISEIRNFMSQLLLKDTFDHLNLLELTLTTNITYTIDGALHPDFYDAGEAELLKAREESHVRWSEVRPFCFSLIKGKHTPLGFHFTFQLSSENTEKLLRQSDSSFSPADVNGLVLNIRFENGSLTCTTGTCLNVFTLDKSLDQAWDRMVQKFFLQQNLSFTLP